MMSTLGLALNFDFLSDGMIMCEIIEVRDNNLCP